MKNLLTFIVIGLLCGISYAQEIDSVILTTTINYPDSLVAAVAANKIGAPLLLTDVDSIPAETQEQLDELSPATIYIIGGPSVISTNMEDTLKDQDYEVIRIWGITRYGTSTEVAEYFWTEGAEKVVIVEDKVGTPENGNQNLLVMAKDLAIANDAPVIISARDVLSSGVEETLGNKGTTETMMVGNFTEDVETAIQELGITTEGIPGDQNRIRDRIWAKIMEMGLGRIQLNIVAVGNWQDTIKAPFTPGNGVSRLISSEDEIEDVIEEINSGDYEAIKVVGKPDLTRQVCDSLTAAGIEHECLTGNASRVAAQIMKNERERIRELKLSFDERHIRIHERLNERLREMEGECGAYFELANATFSDFEGNPGITQQYMNNIREMNQLRQDCMNAAAADNPERVKERLQQLKSYAKAFRWAVRAYIGEDIQAETDAETKSRKEISENIRNQIQEVKRINEEIRAVNEEAAEICAEMVQQMEELENEGEYSKIQNRITVALKGCTTAQEKAKAGGEKTATTKSTTSTTRRQDTTTTNATTTTRGDGRRP